MKKKGLCNTCIHDEDCTFPRRFPVWQCEEFSYDKTEKRKTTKVKKQE